VTTMPSRNFLGKNDDVGGFYCFESCFRNKKRAVPLSHLDANN